MTGTIDTSKTPGRPEILIGLLGIVVVGIGGSLLVVQLPLSLTLVGLILTDMSGIGGLAGFLLAYSIRIRDSAAFGVRRTTVRWMLIALAAGCFAFVVKALAILLVMQVTGNTTNIQEVYATGGSGGWWSLILATLFLAVLTPIGEEFLFRGVVTTALLRYRAVAGVAGGALICAVARLQSGVSRRHHHWSHSGRNLPAQPLHLASCDRPFCRQPADSAHYGRPGRRAIASDGPSDRIHYLQLASKRNIA
ncbi:CPBP family intramembrane metalloprotease (plasmid) [Devosia sp. A8/3-2]|nr:CPBP family intramembrane metalloprotease [Devosia sp. A8/3-2]